jgi:hypothetical protein
MSAESKSAFISRFDAIWAQARRVQLSQALCWAVLTALAGVALLAAADYWLELPLALRLAAVVAIAVGAVAVATNLAMQSVRRWKRQATAAAIEQVFPQLGQRIRTTVQYAELSEGEVAEEGVATSLVTALEDDTIERANPLPLDAVVPWKSLALASLLAAAVGLGLAGLSAFDWQWRAAAKRAFLADDPYTQIRVEPGNLKVKEGESATILVTVEGRTGEQLTFVSRRTDDAEALWQEEKFPLTMAKDQDRVATAEIPLDRVRHPLEYKLAAGSAATGTYKVEVLYPLKVVKIESAITPPAYTGQKEGVSEGGNITGLAGSQVKLSIELDRPASEAWLVVTPVATRQQPQPEASQLPLVIEGNMLSTPLELNQDLTYEIVAKSADGMELPENKYRVRVRQDEPPTVWIESPAEALEVHTLAELLMRVRVSDDYGLSRAGIMFEVNNEEEYPLLAHDFAEAAKELQATGKLSPQTRATLERVLPLEHFELTQQDSIMYYAFAEDIRPGTAQRTESDLRFVDIRPFKRDYALLDPQDDMNMPGNQGPQLKTLEELIARQRYALNRTIQIHRKAERTGEADLSGVDSLVKFQGEVAKFTRQLAEGLEARGIDDTELLYQAEASMLLATDSLAAAKYDTAILQDRDALKYLIEGRDRIRIQIMKNPNRAQLAQLRQFDRLQQQKLRRPKTDDQEAQEVAERLEQLADKEDFVYATIASLMNPGGKLPPMQQPTEGSGTSDQPMPMPAEPMPGDGAKPDGDKPTGDKPMTGEQPGDKGGNEPGDKTGDAGGVNEPAAPPKLPTREELEDQQLDVAAEAKEIEKTLSGLNGVTDLAKERMTAVNKLAEEAANALGNGKLEDAQSAIGAAREQFRELADQVRAILADEQAERIAAAQQMAAELARQQQDFADRLAKSEGQGGIAQPEQKPMQDRPGIGGDKPGEQDDKIPGLGNAARQIAEKAQTLADVLAGAGRPDTPADEATAKKVAELASSMKLPDLTDRLQNLPGQVAEGKMEDAKANVGDAAERLEAAAEQLGALHRSIVAPQVDELAKTEAQLSRLEQQLDELEAPAQITGWHMDAEKLLDELETKGISEEQIKQFVEEMKLAGWGPEVRGRGWQWNRTEGGFYQAPGGYRVHLSRLLTSVRGRMQELMLGDLASNRDEAIPPQYQELVDRYYRVLATAGKEKLQAKPVAPVDRTEK